MRQEIKLRLDTKILDKAREIIKDSESKNMEIDDIIEKWCLERLDQINICRLIDRIRIGKNNENRNLDNIKTLFLTGTEKYSGGRFELEDKKWRYYNNGRRWSINKNRVSSCLYCILDETNNRFSIDLSEDGCNVSDTVKKIILDWLEDDE